MNRHSRSHPLAHLGDAAIAAALVAALGFGAAPRWVLTVYLALEAIGCIARAFNALVDPVISAFERGTR